MATVDVPLVLPGKSFEVDAKAHKLNNKQLEEYAVATFTQLVPVGAILMYAGVVAPAGYKMCDGAAYNRLEYATLYNIIGTVYGVGDGILTFNVPNFTASSGTEYSFPVGVGTGMGLGQADIDVWTVGTSGRALAVNFIIKA